MAEILTSDNAMARKLADLIEPQCSGYTFTDIGTAFGMLMFRMGYKSALEAAVKNGIAIIESDEVETEEGDALEQAIDEQLDKEEGISKDEKYTVN